MVSPFTMRYPRNILWCALDSGAELQEWCHHLQCDIHAIFCGVLWIRGQNFKNGVTIYNAISTQYTRVKQPIVKHCVGGWLSRNHHIVERWMDKLLQKAIRSIKVHRDESWADAFKFAKASALVANMTLEEKVNMTSGFPGRRVGNLGGVPCLNINSIFPTGEQHSISSNLGDKMTHEFAPWAMLLEMVVVVLLGSFLWPFDLGSARIPTPPTSDSLKPRCVINIASNSKTSFKISRRLFGNNSHCISRLREQV
ncbi:hypothetical protein K435DRAFT_791571 [Dendrothele bispora CBS 962.96]|uniref:Uncharacterized protein n=1 Tax=Dendrothele bispora (strain CBS 962.96) TaxID=1314807 RepID=A0A4S8MLH3_DENBC|nr:hypothetical protein K435DRAFT_791571 [Dendrothele bispora CBS 962.96]